MKVGLGLADRFALLGLLPAEGSYITLKLIRDLGNKLGLSDAEHTKYNVKIEGNQVRWDLSGNEPVEIEFGEAEAGLLSEALKKMDKDGKLEPKLLSVYEKFVVAGG